MEPIDNKTNLFENIYACQQNLCRMQTNLSQMMYDIAETDGQPSLFYAYDILSVAYELTKLQKHIERYAHYYHRQRFCSTKAIVVAE